MLKMRGRGLLMLVVLICAALICSGCGKNQRILEKLAMVHTIGYDKGKEGMLNITDTIPNPKSINNGEDEVLQTSAFTSKEARVRLTRETSRNIVTGQLRDTMYSVDVAKDGLKVLIEDLMRDPSISPRVKIVLVNGSVRDLLTTSYPGHPETSKYVDHMLEKNLKNQNVPQVNVYQFARDTLDDGVDPVAPIIRKTEDSVTIDGIALFNDDKYVTKIGPEYNLIFALCHGNFKQGGLNVKLDNEGSVMLDTINSKRYFKVKRLSDGNFRVDINLHLKGSVLEYTGRHRLATKEDVKYLESRVREYIRLKILSMFQHMQDNKVDSLGIGKYVRNSITYKEWKNMKWDELYPQVEINPVIQVRIKHSGELLQLPTPQHQK